MNMCKNNRSPDGDFNLDLPLYQNEALLTPLRPSEPLGIGRNVCNKTQRNKFTGLLMYVFSKLEHINLFPRV